MLIIHQLYVDYIYGLPFRRNGEMRKKLIFLCGNIRKKFDFTDSVKCISPFRRNGEISYPIRIENGHQIGEIIDQNSSQYNV